MFDHIANLHPHDRDYPERTRTIQLRRAILDGSFYAPLPYEFWQSATDSGEPVPMSQRRPSVRYNLCRLVAVESTGLLFSSEHFPQIDCADEHARDTLAKLVRETRLQSFMQAAALNGSVGTAVLLMRVLDGRIFFQELQPEYCTPRWKPNAPDTLLRVTERYKVKGAVLREQGYKIADDRLGVDHWWQREFTEEAELWYVPYTKQDQEKSGFAPKVDDAQSVQHNLGFVPICWVKNLPGGDKVDGFSTFSAAIASQIEVEYQLSQAGRGLRYSSEPTLLVRDPNGGDHGVINKGAGDALILQGEHAEARWMEISGDGPAAVKAYVDQVRQLALESIRGNRSSADKLSAMTSGRAMELLHAPLISLACDLRTSYGEGALLPLIRLVIAATRKVDIWVAGEPVGELSDEGLGLKWPAFFQPTPHDATEVSTALKIALDAGVMSRATAVKHLAHVYDVVDIASEIAAIEEDRAKALAAEKALGAEVQVRESGDAAALGDGDE